MRYKHTTQSVKHFILPENTRFCRIPTESRPKAKSRNIVARFFCIQTERRKLAFVSEGWMQKNGPCVSRKPICFWSMMARGGRENGAKRRNPNPNNYYFEFTNAFPVMASYTLKED